MSRIGSRYHRFYLAPPEKSVLDLDKGAGRVNTRSPRLFPYLFVLLCLAGPSTGLAKMRGFRLYAHTYLDSHHQPQVRLSAVVPYGELVFLKKDDLFESAYELYIKILNKKGDLIESVVLSDQVVAENYEEANSRRKVSKVARTFQLEPGEYTAEAVLAIKNTQLRIPKTILFEVPDYLSSGLGLTIPRLYAVPRGESPAGSVLKQLQAPEELGMTGDEQPTFFGFDKQPAVAFEIFSDSPLDSFSSCRLAFEVIDYEKNQTLYGRETVKLGQPGGAFVLSFNIDDWEPGAYQFNIRAIMESPHREAASSLRFAVEFNRAMIGKYFNQTLEILSLIATKEELAGLRSAAPEDRLEAWRDFWDERDPSLDTETNEALLEHLRRIHYATLNFAVAGPGWRSDRGKIYIKYGEPDHIESSTDPYLQGEYLIWRYLSIQMTFIFYDRFGLGDYHLIRTSRS